MDGCMSFRAHSERVLQCFQVQDLPRILQDLFGIHICGCARRSPGHSVRGPVSSPQKSQRGFGGTPGTSSGSPLQTSDPSDA
jgi:hypothetical protein